MVARSVSVLLAAWCLAASAFAVQAGSASLSVTATIPALAQFRVVAAPPSLEITPEDIRRGHVDVAMPCVVAARTNLPGGFSIRVNMDPQLVAAATVTGFEQAAHVAGGSGLLRVPGPQPQETRYELRWRLQLAPLVQAGSYAWPVQMHFDGL